MGQVVEMKEKMAERKGEFQFIPVDKLIEASANPRRIMNDAKMQELVESVKEKGILTPLLVRPTNGTNPLYGGMFEIAAGHRRVRAARQAGLQEVPAIIREMSDREFLETLSIENLQREDLHPLDEARGYRRLIDEYGYDVPAIVAKVSKSEVYIYQRLKLTDLTEDIQKTFLEDTITLGHALLLARLQPKDQEQAFKEGCFNRWGEKELQSVKTLSSWIDRNIHLDLNSAGFSKKDPEMVKDAGPCTTCQKRTGFQPELFADVKKKDTCTDPACFNAKVEAHIQQKRKEVLEDTGETALSLSENHYQPYGHKKAKDDPILASAYTVVGKKDTLCSSVKTGIMMDGRNRGQVMTVCADPACKVHKKGVGRYQASPEERARRKSEIEKQKMDETIRERILSAIVTKEPLYMDEGTNRIIAREICKRTAHDIRTRILARHGLKPDKKQYMNDSEVPLQKIIKTCDLPALDRLIIEMIVAPDVWYQYGGRKDNALTKMAEHLNVNVKAIEAEVKAEFKEKRAKREKKEAKKSQSIATGKKGAKPAKPKKSGKEPDKTHKDRIPVDQKFLNMVDKSYSGDILLDQDKIRQPFEWEEDLWVCVGGVSSGAKGIHDREAWRALPVDLFDEPTCNVETLRRKWDEGERERGDMHGLLVKCGKDKYVLSEPKITFFDPKAEPDQAAKKTPGKATGAFPKGCICDPKRRTDQIGTNPYCKAQHAGCEETKNGPCGAVLDKDGACSHTMGMDCETLKDSSVKCCQLCPKECNSRCATAGEPKKIRKSRKKAKKPTPGVCRECGCTEEHACEGGCSWADDTKTICSACV